MWKVSGLYGQLVGLLWWLPASKGPCVAIGQRLDQTCVQRVKEPAFLVLTSPNQLDPGVTFYYQHVRYTGVVKKDRLIFLSTTDVRFRTPEGVSPRMTLGQLHLRPNQIRLVPGWAYVYCLPSGWCCAFPFKAKVKADLPVQFLYKN